MLSGMNAFKYTSNWKKHAIRPAFPSFLYPLGIASREAAVFTNHTNQLVNNITYDVNKY